MSVVHDVATRLVSESVGTLNTDLFRGPPPETPDAVVAVIEYAGEPGRLRKSDHRPIDERPRAQVLTRAATYEAAETKARAAYEALHARHVVINAREYAILEPMQPPFFLKEDELNRTIMVFNMRLRRLI